LLDEKPHRENTNKLLIEKDLNGMKNKESKLEFANSVWMAFFVLFFY
jgi:hypothetical protein